MIKLCLDENINPHLAGSLKNVFRRLSFTSVVAEGLSGYEDEPLFAALAKKRINGLITLDHKQLLLDHERQGLKDANLHWIGLPMPEAKGYRQQALIVTSIINGLRAIVDREFEKTPHIYLVPGAANPGPDLLSVKAL